MASQHRRRRAVNSMGARFMNLHENAHKSFHPFPRFPIEIRIKTWRAAMHFPTGHRRIVRVELGKSLVATPTNGFGHVHKFIFRSDHEHNGTFCDPIRSDMGLLVACHESRGEYLRVFKFSLPDHRGGKIRFTGNDLIFIEDPWHLFNSMAANASLMETASISAGVDSTLPTWYHDIKHLAIEDRDEQVTGLFEKHFSALAVLLFSALQDLTLVGGIWFSYPSFPISEPMSNGYLRSYRHTLEQEKNRSKNPKTPDVLRMTWSDKQTTPRNEQITIGCRTDVHEDTGGAADYM